ncbi:hypothetical protein NM688_g1935 [Phlebia brevispora]|uniref:Uncharacterized protein n=1 Tax=Phlebia brevispora TaxID=194682 RepID=A0ACC1TAP7_9APHY|nr:hypothetical protein NM688_g1935 [Phlebia brevispora]
MSVPLASPSALSASPSSEVAAPLTVPTIHNAPPTKVPRAHGGLGPNEQWWHEHAGWLEEKGYRLRPRYRENWTPSWTGTKKKWYKCEDGLPNLYAQFIDATKVSDGTVVALKKLFSDRSPREVEITKYFSTAPRDSDARNHCVPLLETLYLPDGVTILLVLPLLRAFNDPPFLSVGEVLEFCRQICEGLDYIHEHNIAHRDCHAGNIMMDPKPLYPNMFHPFSPRMNLNLTAKAKHFTRTQRPVKYYFIDFGISDRYSTRDNTVAAPVHVGGDRTVPEFQTDSPTHNPFATDVYYIGNLFREELLQKYKRLQLLQPLVDKMSSTRFLKIARPMSSENDWGERASYLESSRTSCTLSGAVSLESAKYHYIQASRNRCDREPARYCPKYRVVNPESTLCTATPIFPYLYATEYAAWGEHCPYTMQLTCIYAYGISIAYIWAMLRHVLFYRSRTSDSRIRCDNGISCRMSLSMNEARSNRSAISQALLICISELILSLLLLRCFQPKEKLPFTLVVIMATELDHGFAALNYAARAINAIRPGQNIRKGNAHLCEAVEMAHRYKDVIAQEHVDDILTAHDLASSLRDDYNAMKERASILNLGDRVMLAREYKKAARRARDRAIHLTDIGLRRHAEEHHMALKLGMMHGGELRVSEKNMAPPTAPPDETTLVQNDVESGAGISDVSLSPTRPSLAGKFVQYAKHLRAYIGVDSSRRTHC